MTVPIPEHDRGGEPPRVINGAPFPTSPAPTERTATERVPAELDPGGAGDPGPGARPARRTGRRVAALLGAVVAVAALGAPLGWLWAELAPRVPVRMTDDGAVLVSAQPEEFAAADGWFTLLGFGFGAVAAIVFWLVLRPQRGPVALLAVTVGAVGAGLLAWWLGSRLGLTEYERLLDSAPVGATFGKPVDLRAAEIDRLFGVIPYVRGDALVPALGAAVGYTLLAGWSRFPALRPEPAVEAMPAWAGRYHEYGDADPTTWGATPVSWDSTATPAPPAAPAPPAPGEAAPPRD